MSQGGADKSGPGSKPPPSGGRPAGQPGKRPRSGPQPPQAGSGRPAAAKSGTQPKLQIGRYRIVEKIGAGGMGAVYRAIHVDLQREVALKILPPQLAKNPVMVARFKREARAAATLQHENIVQIFDVSEDHGRHFLALEFIRGKDLADLIAEKKQLPVKLAVDYLKQATRALDHAFRKGLVHRDIKPSNFLITRDGKVKLCDMGLAVKAEAGEESRVTRDGTTVGTVDYMSPEQARDSREVDTRSDIYSLGCTFYHMLTGRVPFEEGSIPEKLFKHAREDPPDPLQFNPNIPSEVLYILSRMMEKSPQDRYQTPQELLEDLENLELEQEQTEEQTGFQKTLEIGLEDAAGQDGLVLQRRSSTTLEKQRKSEQEQRKAQQLKLIIASAAAAVAILVVAIETLWLFVGSSRRSTPPPPPPPGPAVARVTKPAVTKKAATKTTAPGKATAEQHKPAPKQDTASQPPTTPTAPTKTAKTSGQQPVQVAAKTTKTTTMPVTPEPKPKPAVTKQQREQIEKTFYTAMEAVEVPAGMVRVARSPNPEAKDYESTLEAACRRTQTSGSDIGRIEIEDNGPLFERSFAIQNANLRIRGLSSGRSRYRPVIAYDLHGSSVTLRQAFLHAKNCNLYFEGIDFVVNAADLADLLQTRPFYLFDIEGGDLILKNCTFTVVGSHRANVALVRFSGLRPRDPSRSPAELAQLVLENCYLRGNQLTAVLLQNPVADVVVRNCVLLGGSPGPLFDLRPSHDRAAQPRRTIRLLESTCVAAGEFMNLEGSGADTIRTDFKMLDTVVAAPAGSGTRRLLRLKSWPAQGQKLLNTSMQQLGTLFTGWQSLVTSGLGGRLQAKSLEQWTALWDLDPQSPGVQVKPEAWPSEALGELALVPARRFDTKEVAGDLRGGLGRGIGCQLDQLPPDQPQLAQRTFTTQPPPELLSLQQLAPSYTLDPQRNRLLNDWRNEQARRRRQPNALKPDDQLDPVLELTFNAAQGDLGKFIKEQQQRMPETTVVVVTGSGTHPMSPVHLRRKSLVLWFRSSGGEPLTVVPAPSQPAGEALIQVENGDLIVEGAIFQYPQQAANCPPRFLQVVRGNLLALNCAFYGPLEGPAGFEAAVDFVGGKQQAKPPSPAVALGGPRPPVHLDFHPAPHPQVAACQLINCLVSSNSLAVNAELPSGGIVRVANCVVVSSGKLMAVGFYPGRNRFEPDDYQAAILLEHSTLAAARCFFQIGSWPSPERLPKNPLLIDASNNLWCYPFQRSVGGRRTVLLQYGGRTLQQGILRWQSSHDAFAADLHSYLLPEEVGTRPTKRQFADFEGNWRLIWGRAHIQDTLVDRRNDKIRFRGGRTLSLRQLARDHDLSRLALDPRCGAATHASDGGPAGADFKQLFQ